jgi:hypothetical protein
MLVAMSAFVAAASAAPSPASYRAGLNAMCRSNTVTLDKLKADSKRAQQAKDWHAYGVALGRMLVIALREDAAIEAAPIPTQLRPQMVPALGLLKKADAIVYQALRRLAAGDSSGGIAELKNLGPLSGPVNRYLDAAGLRDCGSNQG